MGGGIRSSSLPHSGGGGICPYPTARWGPPWGHILCGGAANSDPQTRGEAFSPTPLNGGEAIRGARVEERRAAYPFSGVAHPALQPTVLWGSVLLYPVGRWGRLGESSVEQHSCNSLPHNAVGGGCALTLPASGGTLPRCPVGAPRGISPAGAQPAPP